MATETNFKNTVATANDEIAVIIQIEHIDAVKNIEEIVKVPGIDCLFVGPYDLSASIGKTGLTTDPEVQNAINQVKKSAATRTHTAGDIWCQYRCSSAIYTSWIHIDRRGHGYPADRGGCQKYHKVLMG